MKNYILKEKRMSLLPLIPDDEKKLIQKKTMPSFINPMLAQLTDERFSDKDWIFERKLDGERCLMFKKGNTITLKSRNDKILNKSYPEIVNALQKISIPNCILDGEIVALKNNITSFALLESRFSLDYAKKQHHGHIPIYYYIFDIIYYNGYFLTHLPLITRKVILQKLIPFSGKLRYVTHKNTKGELYFKQACKNKWEGLIAKKKDSTYVSKRSSNWLKFKCSNEQEFVIGGYTQPGGHRSHFGALLLGYYDNHILKYAGKVGTGFNEELLAQLGKQLKKYTAKSNPFDNYDLSTKNVSWVKPILVCQVQFTEWTKSNKLRHPSFLGMRRDKSAKDVKKEVTS
jgi:bifunctional non-homologous end joining protein LigD